jgi:hypothetical protein
MGLRDIFIKVFGGTRRHLVPAPSRQTNARRTPVAESEADKQISDLFELYVPEIASGAVRIMAIARDEYWTKVAVRAMSAEVDRARDAVDGGQQWTLPSCSAVPHKPPILSAESTCTKDLAPQPGRVAKDAAQSAVVRSSGRSDRRRLARLQCALRCSGPTRARLPHHNGPHLKGRVTRSRFPF